MNKIIGRYINGNYTVSIYADSSTDYVDKVNIRRL